MDTHTLADSEAAKVDSGLLKATFQNDMHILPIAHLHHQVIWLEGESGWTAKLETMIYSQ